MELSFFQIIGFSGATREMVISYLANALPERNTREQNQRLVGNILSEMNTADLIKNSRRHWIATTNTDWKRLETVKIRLETTSWTTTIHLF